VLDANVSTAHNARLCTATRIHVPQDRRVEKVNM